MLKIDKRYKENIEKLIKDFDTNITSGLSDTQAFINRQKYGGNTLNSSLLIKIKKLCLPLINVFTILLLLAGGLNFYLGEKTSAIFIFICVIVNACIQLVETFHIDRIINSLKKELNLQVKVIRNKKQVTIPNHELVIGDIVLMKSGEIAGADLRIIKAQDCLVNQAIITGESELIAKTEVFSEDKQELEIYQQANMVWSGSRLASGSLTGLVVGVGSSSYLGTLSRDLGNVRKSYFQGKLDRVLQKILIVLSLISVGVFCLSVIRGVSVVESLKFSTIVLVAAVPEGLILGTALVFAISISRISKLGGLVKDFRALEDLGLITMVVFDKTGTLTTGKLKLVELELLFQDKDFDLANFITTDSSNQTEDPVDLAIQEYLKKSNKYLASQELVKIYFNQQYRLSGNVDSKSKKVYLKGAPEYLVRYCIESKDLAAAVSKKTKSTMLSGNRTLIIAELKILDNYRSLEQLLSSPKKFQLTTLGILKYSEKLNSQAPEAVTNLHSIGIDSKLVTGDHALSAQLIASELKIIHSAEEVFSSNKLSLSQKFNKTILKKLQKVKVFARTLPHQKKELVNFWQKEQVLAYVGDGVNDMLSLENSAVGVSFLGSSEVAKSSAGLILRSPDLNILYQAINFSRQTIRNAQKMIFFILFTNLSEVLLIIFTLAIGLPSPISSLQLLWINIVTDTVITLPIGAYWPNKVNPKIVVSRDILSNQQIINLFILATINALMLVLAVAFYHQIGIENKVIQDYMFIAIMIGQGCMALVFRNLNNQIDKIRIWQNKPLLITVFSLILLHFWLIKNNFLGFLLSEQTPILDAVLFGLAVAYFSSLCALIIKRHN